MKSILINNVILASANLLIIFHTEPSTVTDGLCGNSGDFINNNNGNIQVVKNGGQNWETAMHASPL